MMTTYTRLTKAEARLWISEAWSRDISINNVKLRGDWLFVRESGYMWGEEDEVECIYRPKSGDLSGETWDSIRLADSPFIPHNDEAVAIAVAKLDAAMAVERAQWNTTCIDCGAVDQMEVWSGTFVVMGRMRLDAADGFSLSDAERVCTEDERVRCTACGSTWDLAFLAIDKG
jgi:hypothetical protein